MYPRPYVFMYASAQAGTGTTFQCLLIALQNSPQMQSLVPGATSFPGMQ